MIYVKRGSGKGSVIYHEQENLWKETRRRACEAAGAKARGRGQTRRSRAAACRGAPAAAARTPLGLQPLLRLSRGRHRLQHPASST